MRAFALLLILLCAAPARAGGLTPFEDETTGLWGYKDAATGALAIAAKYRLAEPFSAQDRAFAASDQGWVCLDPQGRELLTAFTFDNGPDAFSEGLARFVENGKYGYFDRSCRKVIPANFDFGEPFRDGLAAVCQGCTRQDSGEHWSMTGGAWSCLDRSGKPVAPRPGRDCRR